MRRRKQRQMIRRKVYRRESLEDDNPLANYYRNLNANNAAGRIE